VELRGSVGGADGAGASGTVVDWPPDAAAVALLFLQDDLLCPTPLHF